MPALTYLWVALGGAIGTVLRFTLNVAATSRISQKFGQ